MNLSCPRCGRELDPAQAALHRCANAAATDREKEPFAPISPPGEESAGNAVHAPHPPHPPRSLKRAMIPLLVLGAAGTIVTLGQAWFVVLVALILGFLGAAMTPEDPPPGAGVARNFGSSVQMLLSLLLCIASALILLVVVAAPFLCGGFGH